MAREERLDVRAVIFDMDGLLVDSEPFWRRVEAEIFDALGVDARPYLGHGGTMGLRVDEAIALLCAGTGLEGADQQRISDDVVAGVVAAIEGEAELLPGALHAIELSCDAGLGLALASGSTPPVIGAVLRRFDLREAFSVVASAIDDEWGKPHPAIFLRVAGALGVGPRSCVVFEDSLNGCLTAKAARMGVIAVPHPDDAADVRFAIADVRLSSLLELERPDVREFLGLSEEVVSPA